MELRRLEHATLLLSRACNFFLLNTDITSTQVGLSSSVFAQFPAGKSQNYDISNISRGAVSAMDWASPCDTSLKPIQRT